MKKIELVMGNSTTKIVGEYNADLVYEATSYLVPGAHHSAKYKKGLWDGRKSFLQRIGNKIPTGLARAVRKALVRKGYKVVLKDLRKKPTHGPKISIKKGYEDREYQLEAIQKAIKVGRGILNIATNGGKTYIAARIISETNVKTLFLVHRKELMYQTAKEFQEVLGIKVGMIGDGLNKPRKITVAMIPSINLKSNPRHRKLLREAEMLFADECHHLGSQTWYSIFEKSEAYYKFGLSGTALARSDGGSMYLKAATGKVLVKIVNKDLIKLGVSAKPRVYMQEFKADPLPKFGWKEVYKDQIVENVKRNRLIVKWTKVMISQGKSTLVLVDEIAHGRNLVDLFKAEGVEIAFTHGSTPASERKKCLEDFASGKIKYFIGSGIYNEGVSVSGIDALVFAASKKSDINYLQRVGRGLRRKEGDNRVVIVDFYDKGQKYLQKWSEDRIKIYLHESNDFNLKHVKDVAVD